MIKRKTIKIYLKNEEWLEEDNLSLMGVVLERKQKEDSSKAYQSKIKNEDFNFLHREKVCF